MLSAFVLLFYYLNFGGFLHMKKLHIFRVFCLFVVMAILLSSMAFASILGYVTTEGSTTEIGNGTYLHHNRFWSPQSGVGYQNEFFVVYTPNPYIRPVVTNHWQVFGRTDIFQNAQFLRDTGKVPIAGINGDFFSMQTGISFGNTVVNNRIVTKAQGLEHAIGFRADGTAFIDQLQIFTRALFDREVVHYENIYDEEGEIIDTVIISTEMVPTEVPIHRINKQRHPNALYLYDRNFGYTSRAMGAGKIIVLNILEGQMNLASSMRAVVELIDHVSGDFAIPENRLVLSFDNSSFAELHQLMGYFQVGTEVEFQFMTNNDALWGDVESAMGTHAGRIISNGGIVTQHPPMVNEIANTAAPRTAIGITAEGNVIFYTIDGRQPGHGFGVRLQTLAQRLLELGAVDAINLDGGGSTTMAATYPWQTNFSLVNRPSDGSARRNGNFIFLHNTNTPTGELYRLFVQPSRVHVLSGSYFDNFAVHGADRGFFPAYVPGGVHFSALSGDSIVAPGGAVQAIGTGTTAVEARVGNASGRATVYSVANPSRIDVRHQNRAVTSLTVGGGDEVALTAAAFVGNDQIISQNHAYEWSVDSNIGTVTADGVLTITTDRMERGTLTVRAGSTVRTVDILANQDVFVDISESWARYDIIEVFNAGIMEGSMIDGARHFRPQDFMTRAELTTAIARTMDDTFVLDEILDFADLLDIPLWALNAVEKLFGLGIIMGELNDAGEPVFNPHDNITRAQVFTILGRMLDDGIVRPAVEFTDSADIPSWARQHIYALVAMGIVSGYDDGTILPNNNITRAEIARLFTGLMERGFGDV